MSTTGTDGERNYAGRVGEQRRVTPEHPSKPRGISGAPSRVHEWRGRVYDQPRAWTRPPDTRCWTGLEQQEGKERVCEADGETGRDPQAGPSRREVQALSGAQPCRESL